MRKKHITITGLQHWDIGIGSNCKNLAQEFAKKNRVLYVNPSPSILDSLKAKLFKKHRTKALYEEELNLWIMNPQKFIFPVSRLPFKHLFDFLNKINSKRLAKEIRFVHRLLAFHNDIHFCDSDMFRSLFIKDLTCPKKYIYYTRDNLLAVKFWKVQGPRIEPLHMAKADMVVANSELLAQKASKHNPKSFNIGQGCNIKSFRNPGQLDIPLDIQKIPKPIIGYMGVLSSLRLNIEILEKIATLKKDWSLVLVGPEDDNFKKSNLHRLSNVYFLGAKDMKALPGYLKAFNVAINPQKLNEITSGNYPRKIDEYLAMGKPVVATHTQTMEYFKEHVSLASDIDGWIASIETELDNNSPTKSQHRKSFAAGHTWENNVKTIFELVGQ